MFLKDCLYRHVASAHQITKYNIQVNQSKGPVCSQQTKVTEQKPRGSATVPNSNELLIPLPVKTKEQSFKPGPILGGNHISNEMMDNHSGLSFFRNLHALLQSRLECPYLERGSNCNYKADEGESFFDITTRDLSSDSVPGWLNASCLLHLYLKYHQFCRVPLRIKKKKTILCP